MTTPSSASPVKPILPGVPVPFPCWLWYSSIRKGCGWTYAPCVESWHDLADLCTTSHYLVAPATADPATFPKADDTTNLCELRNPKLRLAEKDLFALRDIFNGLGSRFSKEDATEIRCLIANIRGAMLLSEEPPSAGTEQKKDGAQRLRSLAYVHAPHLTHLQHAAPTDGTTTPRSDALFNSVGWPVHDGDESTENGKVKKAVRQLERELREMTNAHSIREDEATGLAGQLKDLSARLALTEKRLGEAQGELQQAIGGKTFLYMDIESAVGRGRVTPKELIAFIEQDRAQLATSQARLVEVEKERDGLSTELNDVCFSLGCDRANAGGHPADVAEALKSQAKVFREDAEHNATRAEKAESALAQAKQEIQSHATL